MRPPPLTLHPAQAPTPPAAEQTVSPISLSLSSYLTPFVLGAWKRDQITYDELPLIADTSRAAFVEERGLAQVDRFAAGAALDAEQGRSEITRHLIRGLLAVFWPELTVLGTLMLARSVLSFAEPLAINRLLSSVVSAPSLPACHSFSLPPTFLQLR